MGGLDGIKNPLCNLQSWLRLQCNALQKKLYIKSSLWNNRKDSFTCHDVVLVCAPCRPRLLSAPVDAGQQDVRAGDHGPQEEARRGHSWCGLPPFPALHCQRRRRCTCQDLRLTALLSFWWDRVDLLFWTQTQGDADLCVSPSTLNKFAIIT